MPKNNKLILDLGDKGGQFEFKNPDDLNAWLAEEVAKWQWMNQIPQAQSGPVAFGQIQGQINSLIQQWRQVIDDPTAAQTPIASIKNSIESSVSAQGFWLSSSENGSFLLKLKEERGPTAAAGAYVALGGAYSPQNQSLHPQFIDGVIEAFLYKNEIEWSATLHREALEKLKHQYSGNIADQKRKAEQLAETNELLNSHFSKSLKEKSAQMDQLHEDQIKAFEELTDEHKKNIETIEETYNQKLALLKPVQYWDNRRKGHNKKAIVYAIACTIIGVGLFGGLGWVAYELFLNIKVGEQPKVWQMGVFAVAAFFAIWIERILVRLFVSNIHLATDAEERVTMLQTYLSIIREGSEFAPDEKLLILERLFHPATDGMIKDDGAPPTFVELLSRK